MDDPALRVDAIRAIAAFDDDGLGKLLITRYPSFSSAEKAEAIQTLASRGRYGRMLTDALATDVIPKRDVPPYVARQLRRVVGVRFAEVWGPVEVGRGRGTGLRALPRPAERQGDDWCQRRERTDGLSAHLRPVPQDVRGGRVDRSGHHRFEPRQPRVPALERPQPERRGAGRLQDGRRHDARRPHAAPAT